MGLFGGFKRYQAVQNALLAKYTFAQMNPDEQKQVYDYVESLLVRHGFGAEVFAEMREATRFCWTALAMLELDIPPAIPGQMWAITKNPFILDQGDASHEIDVFKLELKQKHNVVIDMEV